MSAIWGTYREKQFYNEPMQKAYYHPSPPRRMDAAARQTSVIPSHKNQYLTAEEESPDYCLDSSNNYHILRVGELGLSPDGDSVILDESWPQSERPSTISIPEVENLTPPSAASFGRRSDNVEKSRTLGSRLGFIEEDKLKKQQRTNSESSGKINGKESTLSRYIERFRNSQPMSREQRLLMKTTDPEDFWWLRSSSSRMSRADSMHSNIHDRSAVLQRKQESSLLYDDELLGKQTRLLQEKTNNFLEKMSSIGSSHPAVSTVGLGSDTGSIATLEEEPYRPAFIRSRESLAHVMPRPSFPEDDVLYRWRMQRKRELAKDRVMQFRAAPAYDVLSRQKVAVIETSGVSDEPSVSHIPIACPHPVPTGAISIFKPCCHLSCDMLTCAANKTCRESRHNATPMGNDDGPKQMASHDHQRSVGSKTNVRKESLSHTFNLDRDISDENLSKNEAQCVIQDVSLVNSKKITQEKLSEKNSKSSRPPKVSWNVFVNRPELSDSDFWQTTDNEDEEERGCSSEADADQRGHRQKKHLMGTVASDCGQQDSNPAACLADDNRRCVIQQKTKSDKERRMRLPTPKNQSSPAPIRSTVGQVITDQLLARSGSLISSTENFELSSLDLTLTELEEPVHDISVLASDLQRRSAPIDLESIICSDGEEFADDEILCNLRQRRLFCLQRLKELDKLILESKTV